MKQSHFPMDWQWNWWRKTSIRSTNWRNCSWPMWVSSNMLHTIKLLNHLLHILFFLILTLCLILLHQTKEDDSQPLVVTHYLFTEWPDHEVPRDKMSMISFIQRVRRAHPPDGPPLMVHCSAGVGRTGTFIVLDTMLQRMKAKSNLNIYEFVSQLREQRCFMVQTQVSYMRVYYYTLYDISCSSKNKNLI